jgi:inner membrane protein
VQKALLTKVILIGALFLALLIPMNMIGGIVAERAGRQAAVEREIAADNYGRQELAGLVLSLPYTEEYEDRGGDGRMERHSDQRVARLFPASSDIAGTATVSSKSRGIFTARVFAWRGVLRGEFAFDPKTALARKHAGSRIVPGKPYASLALADPRGLVGIPVLNWDGKALALERGSELPKLPGGLHAAVPAFGLDAPQRLAYALSLGLQGTGSLAIAPIADNDRVHLSSNWPHPGFGGQFLPQPDVQRVGNEGFEAEWTTSALASKAQLQLLALLEGGKSCASGLCIDRMDVRFVQPIDVYSLSDRAIKYGFLFIAITFGYFLLFELLTGLPVHPAQYFLVGLALATFFLLLIGLSEHIAFGFAYAIATAACVALLGVYLSAALRGRTRGLAFSAMLAALYAALYGLLISEDNALLLGSLLVFGLLAAAMIITRKLDWYAPGAPRPAPA